MAQETAVVRTIRGWISYSDLSSLPKRRSTLPRFLAKELCIIRSFPGNPGTILYRANRSALTAPRRYYGRFRSRVPLWSSTSQWCRHVILSRPQYLSFFDFKWKSVLGIASSVIIIANAMRRTIKTALRSGACSAFFLSFLIAARGLPRIALEKSSPAASVYVNETMIKSCLILAKNSGVNLRHDSRDNLTYLKQLVMTTKSTSHWTNDHFIAWFLWLQFYTNSY